MATESQDICFAYEGPEQVQGDDRIVILQPGKLLEYVLFAKRTIGVGRMFLSSLDLLRSTGPVRINTDSLSSLWIHAFTQQDDPRIQPESVEGWYGHESSDFIFSVGYKLDCSSNFDKPRIDMLEFSTWEIVEGTIDERQPKLFFGNVPCTEHEEMVQVAGSPGLSKTEEDFCRSLLKAYEIDFDVRTMITDILQRIQDNTLRGLSIEDALETRDPLLVLGKI